MVNYLWRQNDTSFKLCQIMYRLYLLEIRQFCILFTDVCIFVSQEIKLNVYLPSVFVYFFNLFVQASTYLIGRRCKYWCLNEVNIWYVHYSKNKSSCQQRSAREKEKHLPIYVDKLSSRRDLQTNNLISNFKENTRIKWNCPHRTGKVPQLILFSHNQTFFL